MTPLQLVDRPCPDCVAGGHHNSQGSLRLHCQPLLMSGKLPHGPIRRAHFRKILLLLICHVTGSALMLNGFGRVRSVVWLLLGAAKHVLNEEIVSRDGLIALDGEGFRLVVP